MRIVKVVSDSRTLATAAADLLIAKAQAAIGTGNRFTVALSGGNTPRELRSRLAIPEFASQVNWESVLHETQPPPFVPRVTLTPVAINSARQVVFLVSGASKAKRLAEVLEIPSSFPSLPAQMIQPEQGEFLWLIDKSAADSIHTDKNG